MANFDTSNNQHAKIRYLDNGENLVVEWKDVYLQVWSILLIRSNLSSSLALSEAVEVVVSLS